MKTVIGDFLKKNINEKFYFHPNPGNAGDSLINVGCYDCFHKYSLKFEEFSDGLTCDTKKYHNKIVVLGGGGGFIPTWKFTRDFVSRMHRSCKLLILLPHTVSGNEDLLKNLGSNVIIFAREDISFLHLKKNLINGAKVYLADDMAFCIDTSKIVEIKKPKLSFKYNLKNIFNIFREKYYHIFSGNMINAFRSDAEKTAMRLPRFNYDISIAYTFGTENEHLNRFSAYKFLKYLNSCNNISTNRLHVAIGCSILNKNVKFYPNNYFKCKAVYNFSIKNKYHTVEWIEK